MTARLPIAIFVCAALLAVLALRQPAAVEGYADGDSTQAAPARRTGSVDTRLDPFTVAGPSVSSTTIVAGATPHWRTAFERSDDLFVLLRSLESAAAAGDVEARWLASRVHEYCAPVARSPIGYARDTALIGSLGLRGAAPLSAARSRVGHRCARFLPTDTLSFTQLVEARQAAALAGSLPAEAALLAMGEPLDDDADYKAALVDRVQASRDPEAFVALAPAMGVAASDDAALAGRVAGTQGAELAWHLAGCRLGQACGPDSALMTQYCANGGICAQNGEPDFETLVREAAIPPADADEIEAMVDALVRDEEQLVGVVAK
ncbi:MULTISPECIES: hypothetical protein [Luteimonas]|uniref:hypothetical protein n=2 Tax=Gammaproteobacteria TaxID=1236 RepID=UPI001E54D17A|nr:MULTISPECIES: hypothetical protein [Luteimonas]